MRKLVVLFVLCLYAPNALANSGFQFSPYSCDFFKPADENWRGHALSYREYMVELGRDETFVISQNILFGGLGGELGTCAFMSSPSDHMEFNIQFVVGSNLDMIWSNCAFAGDQVKYTIHTTKVLSNTQTYHARHQFAMNGMLNEYLVIIGLSPIPIVDPEPLCLQEFQRITGKKLPARLQRL